MTSTSLHFPLICPVSDVVTSFGLEEHTPSLSQSRADDSTDHEPEENALTTAYGALEAQGADAAAFLNGQLTTDISKLAAGRCQTSAICNLKGRVIAQFDIVRASDDRFVLIARRSLLNVLKGTLSRYILRSKVTLASWQSSPGFFLARSERALDTGEAQTEGDFITCRPIWFGDSNADWVMSNDPSSVLSDAPFTHGQSDWSWAHAHVVFGLAPPMSGTELEHIPQMLNLDSLQGVSVTKGCYTGQEIISRVHHRGSVKRRLRRFFAKTEANLNVGDAVTTLDHTVAGTVVEVAQDSEGCSGVLAVIKESAFTNGETGSDTGLKCQESALLHWALPYSV